MEITSSLCYNYLSLTKMDLRKIYTQLECFFHPQAVAVVGASRHEDKVGFGVLKGLVKGGVFERPGLKGFSGRIYAVNPSAEEILGIKCYPSIKNVPGKVDLVIICVNAKFVPQVIRECGEKGVKGVIIISAGFTEAGEEGKKLQQEFLRIARSAGIRVVGPNCLGILYPPNNLNASFGLTLPYSGKVAFISQSGALADSVIDWSIKENYGFSALISYGNKADLDAPDFLAWASQDPHTSCISLYLEGLNEGRYFLEVAREVTKKKPVVAIKAGKSSSGSKAVASHTGSLAGSYRIYEAAFRQCGVIPASSLTDLFHISKGLSLMKPCYGNRVAVVTNGGGSGVLCADACEEEGLLLPPPSRKMIENLDASGKLHPAWSRGNPFDVVGDANPERYEAVLKEVMESPLYDGVIVIQTLQTMTDSLRDAQIIVEMFRKYGKPVVTSFMRGKFAEEGVRFLEENGIPNYNDVKEAARVMSALVKYGTYLKRKK